LPDRTGPDDSPRCRPGRDTRVSDPVRYPRDRLREADAMIAFWERSPKPHVAAEELRYWRRKRLDVLQQIARLDDAADR
jgi:hypothetical protein